MSRKSARIAARIESLRGGDLDEHYLGFFECFNQQLFFEAHDVLEQLWLRQRGNPKDLFFKGLIQLAGAFVHWQKGRMQPAAALLKLARGNLARYLPVQDRLDLTAVLELIERWLVTVQQTADCRAAGVSLWPPRLDLLKSEASP